MVDYEFLFYFLHRKDEQSVQISALTDSWKLMACMICFTLFSLCLFFWLVLDEGLCTYVVILHISNTLIVMPKLLPVKDLRDLLWRILTYGLCQVVKMESHVLNYSGFHLSIPTTKKFLRYLSFPCAICLLKLIRFWYSLGCLFIVPILGDTFKQPKFPTRYDYMLHQLFVSRKLSPFQ